MKLNTPAAFVFSLCFAALPLALAQPSLPDRSDRYNFQTIDHPDALQTYPLGINASREIAGYYVTPDAVGHAFRYKAGNFTAIEHPKAVGKPFGGMIAGGINDRGDIVGLYTDKDGFIHGYLLARPAGCDADDVAEGQCKPAFHDIDVPGAAQLPDVRFEFGTGLGTAAVGINNHRQIVGLFATMGKFSDGFLLADGKYEYIDNPKSDHVAGGGTKLFSINNQGVMVGDYLKAVPMAPAGYFTTYGFIFDGKHYTEIYVFGSDLGGFGLGTQVNGINDYRMVVGTFTDTTPRLRGLIWMNGKTYTLDYPKTPYNEAHSINNRGEITGAYSLDPMGNGVIHGFLAIPKDDDR